MSVAVAVPVGAVSRSPRRALPTVARAISWPLSILAAIASMAWRFLVADLRFLQRVVWFWVDRVGSGLGAVIARLFRLARNASIPVPSFPTWSSLVADHRLGWTVGSGWLRYLFWNSDRIPPLSGNPNYLRESSGPLHEARRRLCKSPTALWAWMGTAIFLYVAMAAHLGWIADGFKDTDREAVYTAPQWFSGPHFLGTDVLGHDVWKLVLRGTTTAIWIGTVSAVLSCVIGTILGALAGYFGRWVDVVIVWIYTTIESIPYLLLLLAFAFVLRRNPAFTRWYDGTFLKQNLQISIGLFTMVFTIGITSWVGVCRTVRGEMLRHRDRDYVIAARALGVPTRRIIFRHLLPNVFHLVLVSFSLLFVGAIKSEVVLSFLGLGLEPGEASWGQMISEAKLELLRSPDPVWWQLTGATVFMFFLVLCVNLFSDALRDALDPKLKH